MNMGNNDDKKGVVNEVVEWRIKVEEDDERLLEKYALIACIWGVIARVVFKVCKFVKKAWEIGVNDPRKFIHGLKVGVALSSVLVFYYMKPLYDGVGGNSMWAVMTVVVVFEHTAGATVSKTINRICGTSLAGFLAMGVHWLASRAGDQYEPVIVGFSLFLLASAATFSRFIPSIKARFDYGAMIFILTFSLVSVSGYRVDKLLVMAQQRLSTIIIGTSLCIIVSMTICPIWAGQELHVLVTKNLDKLATSLQGCVDQYFSSLAALNDEDSKKKLLGYKCVLSSKSSEEIMANFARWEPAHGKFSFRHPWKQYLKIGASMRTFASCIDALIACINSEHKANDHIKKNMSSISLKLGTNSASVIRELATTLKNMTKSTKVDILVLEMNNAAQELKDFLNSHSNFVINKPSEQNSNNNAQGTPIQSSSSSSHDQEMLAPRVIETPLMEIVQVVTLASLLIEIVTRVEDMVKAVEELSDLAVFQEAECIKTKQQIVDNKINMNHQHKHDNDNEGIDK